jgi:hypothetical protein
LIQQGPVEKDSIGVHSTVKLDHTVFTEAEFNHTDPTTSLSFEELNITNKSKSHLMLLRMIYFIQLRIYALAEHLEKFLNFIQA